MSLARVGAAAAVVQGLGLFALTVYFGVLFPSAGLTSPKDFGDAWKYLPIVVAHPSWFWVPAWGLGLAADALFIFALVALREYFRPAFAGWADAMIAFVAAGVVLYLVGHTVNVCWAPDLIADVVRAGTVTPQTAAQYAVLGRIYGAAMLGGSLFTGIGLVILGVAVTRSPRSVAPRRVPGRVFGALAILAGLFDAAAVVALLPPALPLTGAVLVWLGVLLWRGETSISADFSSTMRAPLARN